MAEPDLGEGARAGEGSRLWRLVAGTLLLVMEFVVFAALVPIDWQAEVRETEFAALAATLSPATVRAVQARADAWYDTLCVRTGLLAGARRLLLPAADEATRAHGLGPLVTLPVWAWLDGRLAVIFGTLHQALARVALIVAWWPLLTLLAIAATGEGLLRRRIREAGFRQPSATAHHAALLGFLLLPPLLGLLLFVPLPLPALGVPVASAVLAVLGASVLGQSQKGG
jgi:hypothetical protein